MRIALLPVVSTVLLVAQALLPIPVHAGDTILTLVGTLPVGGTPDAIVVDHSPLHNDVVFFYWLNERVRFVDGESLTLSPDFVAITSRQWEGWMVYNRVHHLVYFIGSRGRVTQGGEPWEEVMVHVLENRQQIHEFSLNEPWNPVSGSPQDPFYEIDGCAHQTAFHRGPEYAHRR